MRRVRRLPAETQSRIWLWLPIPLSPILVLLAPFALLLSLFAGLAPRPWRLNGPVAACRLGAFFFSLSGTVVEIRGPAADVFIRIF